MEEGEGHARSRLAYEHGFDEVNVQDGNVLEKRKKEKKRKRKRKKKKKGKRKRNKRGNSGKTSWMGFSSQKSQCRQCVDAVSQSQCHCAHLIALFRV